MSPAQLLLSVISYYQYLVCPMWAHSPDSDCIHIKIELYFKLLSLTNLNQHTVIVTIIIFHRRGYDYILLST